MTNINTIEKVSKTLTAITSTMIDAAFGKDTRFVMGVMVDETPGSFKCALMGNMAPETMKAWLRDTLKTLENNEMVVQGYTTEPKPKEETTH